jgi:hypothetical protein
MAFRARVCAAAVSNGALLRVVPAPSTAAAPPVQQHAALALTPATALADGATPPAALDRGRVSTLRPPVPLLAMAGARLLPSPNRAHVLALTPAGVLLLHPPDIAVVEETMLSCPATRCVCQRPAGCLFARTAHRTIAASRSPTRTLARNPPPLSATVAV